MLPWPQFLNSNFYYNTTSPLPWQRTSVQESFTVASQALALLSEKSASYLESLSSQLPTALENLIRKVSRPTTKIEPPSPSLLSYLSQALQNPSTAYPATLIAVLLVVIAMSYGHRSNWGGGGGRNPSPYGSYETGPPRVTDGDYSYVTADDIGYPSRTYDPRDTPYYPRAASVQVDDGPDILLLRHKSVTYPLQFPAYALSDGILKIGDVRRLAARETGTKDPRRIKLLYKGRILKDDGLPARSEGLKQESEIMCVVSEGIPNGSGYFENSDSEHDLEGSLRPRPGRTPSTRRQRQPAETDTGPNLAPPSTEKRPSSSGNSRPTSPIPKTALEQLDQLASTFHTTLVPQCVKFMSNPPADKKTRDFEHKKLSETILAQIILKLDEVITGGEEQARQRRKDLVKEAQAMLNRLDEVGKRG